MTRNSSLVFSIIFVILAFLHLQEADPLRWIALFVTVAIACFLSYLQKPNKAVILIGLAIGLMWLITSFSPFSAWLQAEQTNIPAFYWVRLFGGLLLSIATLGWQFFLLKKQEK